MKHKLKIFTIFFLAILLINPTVGAWDTNGTPICTADNEQDKLGMCSDGAGGVIISWEDTRGTTDDIYAQRVSATGVTLWTGNGTAICTADNDQEFPAIITDGAGGAIICWGDKRDDAGDIYAQRVNSTGHIQWGNNGTKICNETSQQWGPWVCATTTGDYVIAWTDHRNGYADIYAQRVNSSGDPEWNTNGVPICTVEEEQWLEGMSNDGAGGMIFTWRDYRNQTGTESDIYVQRVDVGGGRLWGVNGTAVCNATDYQDYSKILRIGNNIYIAWDDDRATSAIYIQKLDLNANSLWTPNGSLICNAANWQTAIRLVASGNDVIIMWDDGRAGNWDIYAQKMNSIGVPLWTINGIPLVEGSGGQYLSRPCSDGRGGVVFSYGHEGASNWDIYAQWIDSNGVAQWTASGVPICNAVGNQWVSQLICDGESVVIAWQDNRSASAFDIYAYGLSLPLPPGEPIPWWLIVIILIAIIALIIVVVYRKKRKKKT